MNISVVVFLKFQKGKYPMSGDKGAMISDKLASENKPVNWQ